MLIWKIVCVRVCEIKLFHRSHCCIYRLYLNLKKRLDGPSNDVTLSPLSYIRSSLFDLQIFLNDIIAVFTCDLETTPFDGKKNIVMQFFRMHESVDARGAARCRSRRLMWRREKQKQRNICLWTVRQKVDKQWQGFSAVKTREKCNSSLIVPFRIFRALQKRRGADGVVGASSISLAGICSKSSSHNRRFLGTPL